MNYEIIKLQLESGIITSGDRKGEKWEGVRATMRKMSKSLVGRASAQTHDKMFFQEDVVDMLKPYITENKPLPDELRIQEHGFIVRVPLGGSYYRVYTKDVVDKATGAVTGRAGERRPDRNGDFTPVDAVEVLAFKEEDDDAFSEQDWNWVESPEAIMTQLRTRYFRPVEAFDGEPKHTVVVPGNAEPPTAPDDAPDDPLAGLNLSPEMLAQLRKAAAEKATEGQS